MIVGRRPKLTAAQVREAQAIRRQRDSVPSARELADRWGVSIATVRLAECGSHKHYTRGIYE